MNTRESETNYVRKDELARRLGVSQRTVERWVKRKTLQLTPLRVGGLTLFDAREASAAIEAVKAKAADNE